MQHARDDPYLDLLLIRHGSVPEGDRRLWGRATAIPLDHRGAQQASALARALQLAPLSAVYTSPRDRAWQTATAIAAGRGLGVSVARAFDELDFGDWTGQTLAALDQDSGWRAFNEARHSAVIPRGEELIAFAARIRNGIGAVERRHQRGVVAIVTHAEVIRSTLLDVLDWSVDHWSRLPVEPGTVSIMRSSGAGRRVLAVNLTPDALQVWSSRMESDDLPIHSVEGNGPGIPR